MHSKKIFAKNKITNFRFAYTSCQTSRINVIMFPICYKTRLMQAN